MWVSLFYRVSLVEKSELIWLDKIKAEVCTCYIVYNAGVRAGWVDPS